METKSEKEFVEKPEESLYDLFKVGDSVIVVDGSYMCDSYDNDVHGINFRQGFLYEKLTIVQINKPVTTRTEDEEYLCPQNNCVIQGNDGKKYYCSSINIRKYGN